LYGLFNDELNVQVSDTTKMSKEQKRAHKNDNLLFTIYNQRLCFKIILNWHGATW
jgi:hypothetical protein